ncbi:MAG: nucleotide disphospho-sugar-binding domain-containing protein [Aliidongia sp.]
MAYNFLLASWGTSGNLNPLLTAGRQLLRSGHGVRLIADEAMREQVEAAEFDFRTWYRAPSGNAADPTDVSDLKEWMRRAIFDPCAAYAADIRDEIGRVPTDGVLAIDALFGAVLGAEAAGVPVALLSPHISIRPLPGIPPAGSGLAQPKTPEDFAEVAAANDELVATLNAHLPILNKAFAQLGLIGVSHVLDMYDRPDRLLLAISRTFDFPAAILPDNFRYVGPLLDQPNWSNPWRAPWPAGSNRPRALIASSTGAQGQADLVQRIIDAMGMVEVDAVATAGPNLDIADLHAPANVRLVQTAPHDAVMKEVSLVVTQGGHGTVNRALVNGLPQLIMPLGRDQGDNAARVEARGAGLKLPASATAEEIAAAVNRLIKEPHFRAAARRIGDAIKADMDGSVLVQEMEAIVAARREPRGFLSAAAQ